MDTTHTQANINRVAVAYAALADAITVAGLTAQQEVAAIERAFDLARTGEDAGVVLAVLQAMVEEAV